MIAASSRAILSLLLLCAVGSWAKADDAASFVVHAEGIIEHAKKLKEEGKTAKAEELLRLGVATLQKRIDADADFYLARLTICEFLLELKQYDAALEQVELLLKKDANSPIYHFLRARTLIAAVRFPDAETATRRAIELDPKCKAALLDSLAVGLIGAKRTPDAMSVLREACQADLSSPDAVHMLALTTFYVEMYDEWEKVLRAGIALHGKERKLHDELTKGLLELQKFDELYQARLEIAKAWPDDADNVLAQMQLAPYLKKPVDPQVHIDRIYALHASGKYLPEGFKRDQFRMGDKGVVVTEFFAVTDDQPRKYVFTLINLPENKKEDQVIVGSVAKLTAFLRKQGTVTDADQPYFVAAEREKVVNYGVFRNLPPYEQVREVVAEIFAGKWQPQAAKLIEPSSKTR